MAVQATQPATVMFSSNGCERPPKWRFKQPPDFLLSPAVQVVKGRRNGGSSNSNAAASSSLLVVKGRRNGGSSNNNNSHTPLDLRCERPPKWRFKQLHITPTTALMSCERPPKWRFKQLLTPTSPRSTCVVKGRRNGGSSNLIAPAMQYSDDDGRTACPQAAAAR